MTAGSMKRSFAGHKGPPRHSMKTVLVVHGDADDNAAESICTTVFGASGASDVDSGLAH